jgi:hypothetical protein
MKGGLGQVKEFQSLVANLIIVLLLRAWQSTICSVGCCYTALSLVVRQSLELVQEIREGVLGVTVAFAAAKVSVLQVQGSRPTLFNVEANPGVTHVV